jgi:hypothetical protein
MGESPAQRPWTNGPTIRAHWSVVTETGEDKPSTMSKQCQDCTIPGQPRPVTADVGLRYCFDCPEGYVPRRFEALQVRNASDRLLIRYQSVRSCRTV